MKLIFGLKELLLNLKRRYQERQEFPRLQSFEKQQDKFRKRYPGYVLGIGTYGLPHVHDDNEGTTLRIGAYCSIASGVSIFLGKNHRTDWISSYPFPVFFEEARSIPHSASSRGDVTIGSDVWLCANCTILSGVTIGHGAVVAAGAVVARDVEPYAVVAGNPAKLVRWRFDEATRQALLTAAWWDWPISEIRGIMEYLCSNELQNFLMYARNRK
jgi:chloramphenicol O-acetyltransferase type B